MLAPKSLDSQGGGSCLSPFHLSWCVAQMSLGKGLHILPSLSPLKDETHAYIILKSLCKLKYISQLSPKVCEAGT